MDCHDVVADDVTGGAGFHGRHPDASTAQCKTCHSDHLGRDADVVGLNEDTFDHGMTDFERILLPEPLEIRYNSEWLGELDMAAVLELTSKATVAQMLERTDFANRFASRSPISVMEFMYPLLQGYDSVAVEADVELGGTDQLWNLMMGRVIQERYGMSPQVALTMPLLVGTDGEQKMSQSLGNYIGVDEAAEEQFGKTMSIPDEAMVQWFQLATELPEHEVEAVAAGLAEGRLHPGDTKRRLAREIVSLYWGPDSARSAEDHFDAIHRRGETPPDIALVDLPEGDPVSLPTALREAGLVKSGGEARRLIEQGAVKIDGITEQRLEVPRSGLVGHVVQVGKRRFARFG